MTLAQRSTRRRMLLASDRADRSRELAAILQNAGEVEHTSTLNMPENPEGRFSGVVVDIDLTSVASMQVIRRKLIGRAYQTLPRLFVLADALHHESTQAWALGATDTIRRPFDPESILHRVRYSFPETPEELNESEAALAEGVAAAQGVMVKIFERLPAGNPLTLDDVMQAEKAILTLKRSTLRDWLIAVNKHHIRSYRHCLMVTGYAVAFAQHLNMREQDQRRLARAALIHDVGKAYIPVSVLDKPGKLTEQDEIEIAKHARIGYDVLKHQGYFPREMLDVVLHHHEFLDGTGYPDALGSEQISDIVRMITIVDIFSMLVEKRGDTPPLANGDAFAFMERMTGKLDMQLLQAFRPVAFGA